MRETVKFNWREQEQERLVGHGNKHYFFPSPPLTMTVKQCLRLSELQEKHGILPWYGLSYISRQNKSRPTRLLENSCVTLQKQLVPPG